MVWSLERGETSHDWELALRLAGALRRFWQVRGYLSEGRPFLENVLAGSVGIVSAAHVKVLIAMGHVAVIQDDYDRVEAVCKESLPLCQQLGDTWNTARTLYLLGWIGWLRGDLVPARELMEQTLALFRQVDDKSFIAWSLMYLGVIAGRQGNYAEGRLLFEESVARQRELGNKRGTAFALCWLCADAPRLPARRGDGTSDAQGKSRALQGGRRQVGSCRSINASGAGGSTARRYDDSTLLSRT